jgi:hypothetical protein
MFACFRCTELRFCHDMPCRFCGCFDVDEVEVAPKVFLANIDNLMFSLGIMDVWMDDEG